MNNDVIVVYREKKKNEKSSANKNPIKWEARIKRIIIIIVLTCIRNICMTVVVLSGLAKSYDLRIG